MSMQKASLGLLTKTYQNSAQSILSGAAGPEERYPVETWTGEEQGIAEGFRESSPEDEGNWIEDVAAAMTQEEDITMDEDGMIHRGNTLSGGDNATRISDGTFAANAPTDGKWLDDIAEAMLNPPDDDEDGLFMDNEGVIHRGNTLSGPGNATKISNGTFAAPPHNPDQWYTKNPALFRAEVANMRRRHPKAKFGFMPQSGDMYWVMELKIGEGIKPWQFMLRYMKDHPNNNDFGGSIRVILLKHPSLEELRERARKSGRPGIPHILQGKNSDGTTYTYLCTRTQSDVADGKEQIASAVQVAAWAGDWALHFEIGMVNKRVWNQWCDEPVFRNMMLP